MRQRYERLKALLKELFQLDQPDLDFGLYRVMHAKSAEVSKFLDEDLLPQVRAAFEQYKSADKDVLEKALFKVIAGIEAAGMNPDDSPKVKDLRTQLKSESVSIAALESDVYDHLFSFFRRYYSDGDFLAKRVYKPGAYAIPYEGEEVVLHWANKDQYYIKTSEYLRDYTFRVKPNNDKDPMLVHFRLVDVAEGEHGNKKAAEGRDRQFILATSGESGNGFMTEHQGDVGMELLIGFEYRPPTLTDWPDEIRTGKTRPPTRKNLNQFACNRILAVSNPAFIPWTVELRRLSDTGHSKLETHLNRYTARNTFDYFIHKDLGAFLRRELDFYIKSEVMHLDDVENVTAPRVDQYLSKIKVIRNIAGKIIDFLVQLEGFQKNLWTKRKFIVDTQYCVTVKNIPETFYEEIAANVSQQEEWVKFLGGDDANSEPNMSISGTDINSEFLKMHPTLIVDTRHFNSGFTERLLGEFEELE